MVAYPSFRTRGDYLAIVTLAFNMIVKSVLENISWLGGPRGYLGMPRLTTLFWVAAWVILTLWVLRNLVYSNFGRGITAIREDEVAANLTSVDTRRLKLYAFLISAFFAGVAGGLYAHLLQFINPRSFSILKSTDMLVMVYLGGVGSLTGSLLGAAIFTVLLELLRPLGIWRWVVGPLHPGPAHDLTGPRGSWALKRRACSSRRPSPREPGPPAPAAARAEPDRTHATTPGHQRPVPQFRRPQGPDRFFPGDSTPGSWWGSSAPTAPARPPCSISSPGSFPSARDGSSSGARTSATGAATASPPPGLPGPFRISACSRSLSVLDNVRLGAFAQHRYSLLDALRRSRRFTDGRAAR